jgi:hypothetical protein
MLRLIGTFVFLAVASSDLLAYDLNTITFTNQSGQQALVKVVGPTPRAVAVPDRGEGTVRVAPGTYYTLVRYGEPPGYSYTRGDSFTVTQSSSHYSVITITLHKVVGGNYGSRPTSAEQFDRERADSIQTAAPPSELESLRQALQPKGTLMKIITLHPLVIVVEGFYASASEIRRTWDTSPSEGT